MRTEGLGSLLGRTVQPGRRYAYCSCGLQIAHGRTRCLPCIEEDLEQTDRCSRAARERRRRKNGPGTNIMMAFGSIRRGIVLPLKIMADNDIAPSALRRSLAWLAAEGIVSRDLADGDDGRHRPARLTEKGAAVKLVFISGAYTAPTGFETERNIREAEAAMVRVAEAGMMPVCPHTMCRYMDGVRDWDFWMKGCISLLDAVAASGGAILMLDGWEQSRGSRMERDYAESIGLTVVDSQSLDDLAARTYL